jgi:hypothetical protein
MPALEALRRPVFGSETVPSERRNCGTTVEGDTEGCPECGAADAARYQLSS